MSSGAILSLSQHADFPNRIDGCVLPTLVLLVGVVTTSTTLLASTVVGDRQGQVCVLFKFIAIYGCKEKTLMGNFEKFRLGTLL